MSTPEHLEEVSTKERITLVDNDKVRRIAQISIAIILIGSMIGYLFWYSIFEGDEGFRLSMANDMKVLLIMGVGAALAIFGLGRTVGRTNPINGISYRVGRDEEHEFRVNDKSIFKSKDDELRDLIENQEEDRPTEVPITSGRPEPAGSANIKPESTFFLADRDSWNNDVKRIQGNPVKHVAIQQSRRAKRTIHVYHIQGTNIIVYNRSRDGVYFMRIAIRPQNVQQYYEVFVEEPLNNYEKEWLERYDYVLAN